MGDKKISIHGDYELIIKQIKVEYASKHSIMRAYRNVFLDFLKCFSEYQLSLISRDQNVFVDAFATSESTCKIPFRGRRNLWIDGKHRPAIHDNMRYSQVFDNAKQLNNFLPLNDEFESLNNDIGKDIDDSG